MKLFSCPECGNSRPLMDAVCPYCKTFTSPTAGELHQISDPVLSINLESGFPTTEQALIKLHDVMRVAGVRGLKILKIIHGYGSTGNGGKIRSQVRSALERGEWASAVTAFIPGENISPTNQQYKDLVRKLPMLKKRLARTDVFGNPGITIALIGKNVTMASISALQDGDNSTPIAAAFIKASRKPSTVANALESELEPHRSNHATGFPVPAKIADGQASEDVDVPIEVRLDLLRKRYIECIGLERRSRNIFLGVSSVGIAREIERLEKVLAAARMAKNNSTRKITKKTTVKKKFLHRVTKKKGARSLTKIRITADHNAAIKTSGQEVEKAKNSGRIIRCATCYGVGVKTQTCRLCNGKETIPRKLMVKTLVVCANVSPTCQICGGTGVGYRLQPSFTLEPCTCINGSREVACSECGALGWIYKDRRKIRNKVLAAGLITSEKQKQYFNELVQSDFAARTYERRQKQDEEQAEKVRIRREKETRRLQKQVENERIQVEEERILRKKERLGYIRPDGQVVTCPKCFYLLWNKPLTDGKVHCHKCGNKWHPVTLVTQLEKQKK